MPETDVVCSVVIPSTLVQVAAGSIPDIVAACVSDDGSQLH